MSDAGSGAFCPRCGDPVERPVDVDLPGARGRQQQLCDACYFADFDLVDAPEEIRVRTCATCGAVHRGNRWVDVGARDYTDVAVEAVSEVLGVHVDADEVTWGVEPEQVDATTVRVQATFSGVVRGTPVAEEVTVPVTIARETCTRCGRIAGDYYGSVVQVRAADRAVDDDERERAEAIAAEVVAGMEATGDRDAFVTEVGAVDGGLDLKVSTNRIGEQVARRVVEEFGGSVTEHETLVTEDGDGNEVYRVTYAVRLPPFRPGDVIDPEDDAGPVLVRGVKGALTGVRLATGADYRADREAGDAPDARLLGTAADAEETAVVAVEDERAIQVLHPASQRAVTIPRPDFLDADAGTVYVLDHRGGLHAVPDDAAEDHG